MKNTNDSPSEFEYKTLEARGGGSTLFKVKNGSNQESRVKVQKKGKKIQGDHAVKLVCVLKQKGWVAPFGGGADGCMLKLCMGRK